MASRTAISTYLASNISDGKLVATGNPNLKRRLGEDVRTVKDVPGDPLDLEAIAQKPEGEITILNEELPKPADDKTPVPKKIYTTKVEDLVCGVGYYYFFYFKN